MSFYSDKDIQDNFKALFPSEERLIPDRLQPSSYELRLGSEVFISGTKKLVRLGEDYDEYLAIRPGDMAILLTKETVDIPPDIMGFIAVRTKYKNRGLVNISGFHVDPGFKGKLTFSVYNAGPSDIILRYLDPVFIIFFATLSKEAETPYDKEQKKISAESMSNLAGESVSPLSLHERLSKLEHTTQMQWGLFAAVAIGVFITIIKVVMNG